jgi:hypothetical protein
VNRAGSLPARFSVYGAQTLIETKSGLFLACYGVRKLSFNAFRIPSSDSDDG